MGSAVGSSKPRGGGENWTTNRRCGTVRTQRTAAYTLCAVLHFIPSAAHKTGVGLVLYSSVALITAVYLLYSNCQNVIALTQCISSPLVVSPEQSRPAAAGRQAGSAATFHIAHRIPLPLLAHFLNTLGE